MPAAADPWLPAPAVARALYGAVDLHCHTSPSPFPRRITTAEAVRDGARIGMRAVLAKSHHHDTVTDLLALAPWLKGESTASYGGIALNSPVGGMNPSAVALSLRLGGRAVWAPTISAAQHLHRAEKHDGFPEAGFDLLIRPVSVLDERGELSATSREITGLVAEAGAMLAGGHLDPAQMIALFSQARADGVRRLLVQHPDYIVEAGEAELERLLSLGAFVEHEIAMYHPQATGPVWPISRLLDWIERVGAARTVICSDLGQQGNPLPVDGYLHIGEQLLRHGVSEYDLRTMICVNTAYLLGLEDTPA